MPTAVPRATRSSFSTVVSARYEYDVTRPPPWSIDTLVLRTTTPANRTTPAPIAGTAEPDGDAISTPQCPAQRPIGANERTTCVPSGTPKPKQPDDTIETGMRSVASR
jgi:hypothetical protein